ncbi:MAG: hypothetical protein HRT71_18165 [Flavobacteriales bacterium]|nr:hypothetical protein [Flavobacteriales bacterium]
MEVATSYALNFGIGVRLIQSKHLSISINSNYLTTSPTYTLTAKPSVGTAVSQDYTQLKFRTLTLEGLMA